MACPHSGEHSGASRYERGSGQLRLVLVCDLCGAERAEMGILSYRPRARRFVARLAELTARELGLGPVEVARVRLAAMVCDVGRDQIPPEILQKPGPLTPEEWEAVRRQPELGAALLTDASFDDIRNWVLRRRERIDGGGYPGGLREGEITLEARILAVAEAYVAMTEDRAHPPRRDREDAISELLRCSGTQFDAAVVRGFVHAYVGRDSVLASGHA